MANGYAGKILKVDLTTRKIEEIPTADYEEYGGGHGIGSALFWDLCEDVTVNGDDPKNVVTIMGSPLSGTLTPSGAGRTEVQGIGLQSWPRGWFTRSNFGGRFSTQMKYAGWDGVVLLGKADSPVWLNVVDDKVTLEDATELWGLDTFETQKVIHSKIIGSASDDWSVYGGGRDSGRSTQRPAVLTMGPNAEKFAPFAALIHDAGNGAGQGGFGGVFASKNIKAVSFLGTGGVEIADPDAMMEARLWLQQYSFAGHPDTPNPWPGAGPMNGKPGEAAVSNYPDGLESRPQGCVSCVRSCRARNARNQANESSCSDFWPNIQLGAEGMSRDDALKIADLNQRYGINTLMLQGAVQWFRVLRDNKLIGKGCEIESSLPFDRMESYEWSKGLLDSIVTNTDIGQDLALGVWQCAEKWGRREKDWRSGWLSQDVWGYTHHYDPRAEAEWGYGGLLGDRDINEHDFNFICYWVVSIQALMGTDFVITAERMAEIIGGKLAPYNDPMMIDYSDEGIYSEAMAKTVAWHRHYTRYYKESLGFCDWAWADFVNPFGPDMVGSTGEGEPKFVNAVTGKNQTFEQGIEVGRKIWNLDRAIWALQGRHRDMEVYSDYIYEVGSTDVPGGYTAGIAYEIPYWLPVFENGEWSYKNVAGRKLDREKVEAWKTKYYKLEGWDTNTGWPTRKTLEDLGLTDVADKLEAAGKLGAA